MKDKWDKEIEKENKKIAEIERAIEKVERARDRADRKAENKALARFERIADREMHLYDKDTRRDF